MEWLVLIVVVLVGLWIWGSIVENRRQQERYHGYIDAPRQQMEEMRQRILQANEGASIGEWRRLKADIGQLKKELVHHKRVVHDVTKATNRANRGGGAAGTSARASARWPSEQATTDLDRLIIQLDGWRVEIDAILMR